VAAVLSCLAFEARAGDLIDTRLSFVFSDDNVLAKEGETTPNSPNARFGANNRATQFYDNFNTRFSGFETLSHIVLYKKSDAFFEGLSTEASMNLLLLERENGSLQLQDDTSYIQLNYRPAAWARNEQISFTGFPVSSDRFRLGYAYRITWGGTSVFTNRAALRGVPGAKLQISRDRWYAFAGAKTALVYNDLIKEEQTLYGALGGAGVDVTDWLRIEANGGYFQKGQIPGLAAQNIEAYTNSAGGSAQVVYHVGEPVGQSVDLRLYKNDPEMVQKFFSPERYPGGVSFYAALEGSLLYQTLSDPDVFARTVPQQASAAALQVRTKINYLRLHFLGLYRTLSFIVFNQPGQPPFSDFPNGTELKPEVFGALGLDYHFPRAHLTPGVIVGVQQPASYLSTSPFLEAAGRTVVVRELGQSPDVLPAGTETKLILSAKTTTKWDISESVAAVGEVYYTYDPNRITFRDDATGVAQPTFDKPHALGFNVILQARF
jgi:hypothetical protein